MRKVILSVCLAVFMSVPVVQAADNFNDGVSALVDYAFIDTGWNTASVTSDCDNGWADDTWELTLTSAQDLTVRVLDCCVAGDYYEIYVNQCLIGTTPEVEIEGTTLSDGSFTISLEPGTYLIKVRLALEDFGTLTGCPAGFEIWGSLADYTGDFPPCTVEATIDIKPGSCPNPFNGKSKGSVPVAIVGTADLDVTTIDPASITLAGVPALAEWEIKDSTQPDGDNTDCFTCFDAGDPANFNCDLDPLIPGNDAYCGDGYPDLIVKFDTQALAAAIGPRARDACVTLDLTGLTIYGWDIAGSDAVIIRTK